MAAAVDEGWVVQVLVERPDGEALVGLELSSDARRQAGLAGWPVRSCAVFDGAEYTAVQASGRTPALDTEPGQGR